LILGGYKHLDVFADADSSRKARCTSSRVTWGGGECLDDAGELANTCPRHQPATYARLAARHRRDQVLVTLPAGFRPAASSRSWLAMVPVLGKAKRDALQ
jgi:hypothetical protein